MFALDNLVKKAVIAGILVLSPEYQENLNDNDREFGYDEDDVDEMSNSGVSTVNSAKIKHHKAKDSYDKKILEQMEILKNENSKLMNEILESYKSLQSFLKASESGVDAIKYVVQQFTTFTRKFERSVSFGYHSDDQNPRKSSSDITPSDENSDSAGNTVNCNKLPIPLFKNPQLKSPLRQSHDVKLTDWLTRNGFDEDTRNSIGIADFTYEDLIYFTDKDDIRRIGLR